MKGLAYHGPGNKAWEDVPVPGLREPSDVIVRVETTTICGTDLHILKGDVAAVTDGRILGHEAIGTIVDRGPAVTSFEVGDRVIVPAITSCGRCSYCRRGMPSQCESCGGVGWIFGHLIDGTQAEMVRVPFADTSLHRVPDGVADEQVLFLCDILPTGYEVGVLNGGVKPGDTIAVVGSGPVGLAAIMTSNLYGPARVIAIDPDEGRLRRAMEFGATDVYPADPDTVEQVKSLTDGGLGVDVAMEAVGIPATLRTCVDLARPGGRIANLGVHGVPVELPMQTMWIRNLTLTTGLVDATSVEVLLRMVVSGRLPAEKFATHRFKLDEIMDAYQVFGNAAEHDALKVVLSA
jgi:alcohol dehydrogenase